MNPCAAIQVHEDFFLETLEEQQNGLSEAEQLRRERRTEDLKRYLIYIYIYIYYTCIHVYTQQACVRAFHSPHT
jgi:hypothetical protein